MRITDEQRRQIEDRIRAAMDRLLRGELPPGGKCDVKTLSAESGVTRAALYTTYLHLKEEFERRRDELREAGVIADPREGQIARLKEQVTGLKERLAARDAEVEELKNFRTSAVSRLAIQHEEITRLREVVARHGAVRSLSTGRRDAATTADDVPRPVR
ncbi:hypothetical protein [Amycolatopsis sp. cmx-4-68]|uniref:hypothetical protein n=1 Tax=Amycolatopsis sp. cmx-4-68 TaxID=2790938 RepID=UPI00397B3A26